eukprot:41923_1
MSSGFLSFGRYEGSWKDREIDTQYECELVIDENNFKIYKDEFKYSFEGYFEWRTIDVPDNIKKTAINTMAMEKVKGYYFNDNECDKNDKYQMIAIGYEMYQSPNPNVSQFIYWNDAYRFRLDPNISYKTIIESFSCDEGKWNNPINIKRVASKNELIELLTFKFGNEKGIVHIVADMLHYFEIPHFEVGKVDQIKSSLEHHDKRLKLLFPNVKLKEQVSES